MPRAFGRFRHTVILSVTTVLVSCSPGPSYDLLIINGQIVDGSGRDAYESDIAIGGNIIVEIGELEQATATKVIDAAGLTVTPGFIDLHNHADRNIKDHPDIENYLFQGVTTILAGNCGNSPVHFKEYSQSINESGLGLNMGLLIGHNSVRSEVMGNDNRAPSSEEQAEMEALVKAAMDDGAFGLSTGLIYLPGTYSDTDEVVALARVAGREGGIYASHIRNEFELIFDAIEEAINVGREANLPVHMSHYKVADNTMWGDSVLTLGLVEAAIAEGLDVSVDQYPYTAGSTGLANVLPKWARAGSDEEFRARLDNPESRAQIRAETIDILNGARAAGDLSRITVSSFESHPQYVGKTMAEVTQMHGLAPTIENGADVAMKILYDASGSAIYHMMVEEDVQRIMKAPFTSIASDGSAVTFGEAVPHLRNYGTFPRVLGKYVRDDGVLSLAEAIHKMTAQPADRIGLATRGRIAVGMVADISIFDAEMVGDNDDWARPHQYAEGFAYVIVDGVAVIDAGELTGQRPGTILQRSDSLATEAESSE